MHHGPLFRRLILPNLLIICAAVVAVAALARAVDWPTLLWAAAAVMLLAAAGSAFVSYAFARRQVRQVAALFHRALPASESDRHRLDDTRALERLADAFIQRVADSQKDQAQLLTIISSMTDALLATDHGQRILLTNQAATELLNVPPAATGRPLWEVLPVEGILRAVSEVSLTGQRKTVPIALEDSRHLEVTVSRLPLRPAGFVIIARDVTEATRYEELRKDFVANVSHELRTPLTLIRGYIETLLNGALAEPDRAQQYLGTVDKHSQQLANLIEDLLNLSRLDSARGLYSPAPVRMEELAERVRELLLPAAQKKGQALHVEVQGEPAPVMADAQDLERALTNLLDNAIKYTRPGGNVRVVVAPEGPITVVQVIDSGVGIAAADLPRVFERFYRVDRSRSREMGGTGLGLSIVKHVVQLHGGTIEVESTPGSGSCFTIRLPAAAA